MITFHHANTRGSRVGRFRIAHLCVLKTIVIHVSCLFLCPDTDHKLSPTSPSFPTISPTHTRPSVRDPYLPCDVPHQSGGSTQIPSLTEGKAEVERLSEEAKQEESKSWKREVEREGERVEIKRRCWDRVSSDVFDDLSFGGGECWGFHWVFGVCACCASVCACCDCSFFECKCGLQGCFL